MKKRVVIIMAIIIAALVVSFAFIGVFAAKTNSGVSEIFNYWLEKGEKPENADLNDDGKIDVLDAIALIKEAGEKLKLKSITLDDSRYELDFKSGAKEFTVNLPDGRPAIPQINATANAGSKVEIAQGYIPDGEKEGYAYIKVTSGKDSALYTVKFVRDITNGFVLQYDDRYEFPLEDKTGYIFTSNDTALEVDANGLMIAKKVTDSPITVTATKGSETKTLVVDRIEKAHVNLFFITGQSNGQGCYDGVNYDGSTETFFEGQIAYTTQLKAVEKIGQNGRVYSYDVHPRSENQNLSKIGDESLTIPEAYTLYDMQNHAKQGHQASLGKNWYDLTGEKVVFLQSAWSGAPIEAWIDPDKYSEAGGYGVATRNFYKSTKEGYERLLNVLSENYEIIRKANFWCQGETAMTSYYDKSISNYIFGSNASYNVNNLITDAKYYEYFMRLDADMREDFGLDFNGIMMVKTKGAQTDTTIVPIVSAHFALANTNDGIFTATRTFIEIARQYTSTDTASEGYAFMGTDSNHYNQIGYNYHGKEAAENAFGYVFKSIVEDANGVEIISADGKTRLTPDDTIEVKSGMTYRVGALSIPRYTSEKITWSSSDENIAVVNEFGVVSPVSSGSARITATAENGAKQSFNVKTVVPKIKNVNYRWDFNDLTSSGMSNDLMLSQHSASNYGNYTLSNGIYSTKSGLGYTS
ncbi:MAG: Ig-like domain-containing protein, partial [Clostridia bacterium]|nr:Ig-like domain-containing protein [Clostridia bacterium]